MTSELEAKRVIRDLGTLGDAARVMGLAPNVVGNWAARFATFPRPIGTIGRASVYHLPTVLAWIRENRAAQAVPPSL